MTPKIAPTFDGLTSWFEYEDCIDDWLNLTTLTPRKNGPSLKNSLVGAAAHYKGMLENRLLTDPDNGVDYLKRTLRPFFTKNNQHGFLSRFLQLFRQWRGSRQMVTWIGLFEITMRRLQNAWMDLYRDLPEPQSVEFTNTLTLQPVSYTHLPSPRDA